MFAGASWVITNKSEIRRPNFFCLQARIYSFERSSKIIVFEWELDPKEHVIMKPKNINVFLLPADSLWI